MLRSHALVLYVLLIVGAFGCIRITNVSIGQKTSLERQLIGELEPLSDEELLAASVRAPRDLQVGALSERQTRAIAARQRQLFNRDDVIELKGLGCLGEARDAMLVARSCDASISAGTQGLRARLIDEENADRRTILDWVHASEVANAPIERAELVALYHEMLAAQARSGEWVETASGEWQKRP